MKKLRLYIIILSLLALVSAVKAQVGEPRSDWDFGVNGGVLVNRVSFNPRINQSWHVGETAGVTVRYTCEKYYALICALQLEVNYARMGWKEDIVLADGTLSSETANPETYQRDLHYIQVPLLARLGMGREKRGMQGYLVAGPQVGWLFKDTSKHSEYWNPSDRVNGRNKQYDMDIKHKFDYGITAGLGMELSTVAGHFLIEGRYYFGLADLFGNSKKDVFARSANGAIVAKVTYMY